MTKSLGKQTYPPAEKGALNRASIERAVLDSGADGVRLAKICEATGVAKTAAGNHLAALMSSGKVARIGIGPQARWVPAGTPNASVQPTKPRRAKRIVCEPKPGRAASVFAWAQQVAE